MQQLVSVFKYSNYRKQVPVQQLILDPGGVALANYLRSNASDPKWRSKCLHDTGMVVGVDSDLTIGVSGSDVSISNATSDGDILIKVNDGGVVSTAMTIDGATTSSISRCSHR